MSDINNSDIDLSIDVTTDVGKEIESLQKLEQEARKTTTALRNLGNVYQAVTQQQIKGFQNKGALPHTWDAMLNKQLTQVADSQKRDLFLKMMDETTPWQIKHAPASKTGKYHPSWANTDGGLIKHSKAVANAALRIADDYKYTGDKDDLRLAALGHDAQKLGMQGKFYDAKHDEHAASLYKAYGLGAAADMVSAHMGGPRISGRKDSPAPESLGQKILSEADWLVSRKYAEDYVKFDDTGEVTDVDLNAIRKEAIARGEGKYDKNGQFQIIGSVEQQEKEKAKASKEWAQGWNNVERDARRLLTTLTSIAKLGLGAIVLGGKVVSEGSNALSGGARTLTNQNAEQVMQNRLAAGIVGLGTGAINDEIASLALKRGSFTLMGEAGDLLPMALAKNLDALLTSGEDVNEVYWKAADIFAGEIAKAKDSGNENKVRQQMLLAEKTLGVNARKVIDYAVVNTHMPSDLRQRTTLAGGALNWHQDIQSVNREFKVAIDDIKDSFTGIFKEFMKNFGNPITIWFANFLKGVITDPKKWADSQINEMGEAIHGPKNELAKFVDASGLGAFDMYTLVPTFNQLTQKHVEEYRQSDRAKILNNVLKGGIDVTSDDIERVIPGYKDWNIIRKRAGLGKETLAKVKADVASRALRQVGVQVPTELTFDQVLNLAEHTLRGDEQKYQPTIPYSLNSTNNMKLDAFRDIRAYSLLNRDLPIEDPRRQLSDYITSMYSDYNDPNKILEKNLDTANLLRAIVNDASLRPERAKENLNYLKDANSRDVSIMINNSFPNAINAREIKEGVETSVEGVRNALDSYAWG